MIEWLLLALAGGTVVGVSLGFWLRRRDTSARVLRRLVLVHQDGNLPSIEGVLVGRGTQFGHYRLEQPKIKQAEGASLPIDGAAEIPASRVVFIQVLAEGVEGA